MPLIYKRAVLVSLCLSIIPLAAFSIKPFSNDTVCPFASYKHFGQEEGLTSKTVYAIIQDTDGFIWLGTDAGVFRYDGKFFKRFTISDGLTDNEVLKIYQDKYKRIWFLTFNGHLSFWLQGKIHSPSNTPFLKDAYTGGTISSYYEDTKGRFWLGTEKYGFIVITGDSVAKIEHEDIVKLGTTFVHED